MNLEWILNTVGCILLGLCLGRIGWMLQEWMRMGGGKWTRH